METAVLYEEVKILQDRIQPLLQCPTGGCQDIATVTGKGTAG